MADAKQKQIVVAACIAQIPAAVIAFFAFAYLYFKRRSFEIAIINCFIRNTNCLLCSCHDWMAFTKIQTLDAGSAFSISFSQCNDSARTMAPL